MTLENAAAPDVKLLLDLKGIIREASLSDSFPGEMPDAWIGLPWSDTVRDSDGDHLKRMLEDARDRGVSAFRQVVQRLPSGREVPIEYTTVRLGGRGGLLAVGKNLRAISELQNRLVEAQQAMERDYWKLREIETRYRLLFTSSRDAVLLLDSSDLSVLELNPAAGHALGLPANRPRSASSVQFTELLLPEERGSFEKLLRQVRERGKAPGILLRLGPSRETWLARASLMASALAEVFLLQLSPSSGAGLGQDVRDGVPVETLVERAPDGFVAIDGQGTILRANRTFLDLAQVGSEAAVVGEPLGRWLGRPGADIAVLLANVMRLGAVRLLSTTLHGELGSENEVEISACGSSQTDPSFIGVFVRDVGRRLAAPPPGDEINQLLNSLTKQIGKTSLRKLVEDTIRILEQHYIHAALGLTGGNRTATAELLGLSRQSLYVKLNRYGLDGDDKPESGS